jgi:hypothetical protein
MKKASEIVEERMANLKTDEKIQEIEEFLSEFFGKKVSLERSDYYTMDLSPCNQFGIRVKATRGKIVVNFWDSTESNADDYTDDYYDFTLGDSYDIEYIKTSIETTFQNWVNSFDYLSLSV